MAREMGELERSYKPMKGLEWRGLTKRRGAHRHPRARPRTWGSGTSWWSRDRGGGGASGRIIEISEEAVVVQVFGATTGLSTES